MIALAVGGACSWVITSSDWYHVPRFWLVVMVAVEILVGVVVVVMVMVVVVGVGMDVVL